MSFVLSRRPAKLGSSINTRPEKHGDEDVAAFDIPVADVLLTAEELNSLLADPSAHMRLFDEGTEPLEPAFKQLDPFTVREKIEGARIVIGGGDGGGDIVFSACKLKGFTLDPQLGGMTKASFKVQCLPNLEKSINSLFIRMNHEIMLEVLAEQHGSQAQLPLSSASIPAPGAEA